MKKADFIIVTTLLLSTANAQTKSKQEAIPKAKPTLEETMNWITDKLNIYSSNYVLVLGSARALVSNFEFTYDNSDSVLVINYEESWSITTNHYITKLPIKHFDNVIYNNKVQNNEYLEIYTYGKVIYEQCVDCSTSSISYQDMERVPIDISRERNLLQRLQKAFSDVKSHFSKKQETY